MTQAPNQLPFDMQYV